MAISAQDVNKLRKMTGAGMMDCKKALTEAEGDFDKAIEILRKKGQKVSASRADRETSEGIVFVKTSKNKQEGLIITLTCETDFVAKNDDFKALGAKIASLAFSNRTKRLETLLNKKIGDLTVSEKLTELIGKIGEKIVISNLVFLKGEVIVPYIHAGDKLGVLVALKGANGTDVEAAGKDIGMQIAAMKPVAVNKDGVDPKLAEKELEIGREQALAEGKPEKIVDKIAQGKLNKFFKESTLLSQDYVKDSSMSVEKYLDSVQKGLTVTDFKRIEIGG